ncbi:MAG: hypothetical protein CYG60_06595, partial [Actinobacteria bacterium]
MCISHIVFPNAVNSIASGAISRFAGFPCRSAATIECVRSLPVILDVDPGRDDAVAIMLA